MKSALLWDIIDNTTSTVAFTGTSDECMGWLWMSSEPYGDYSVQPNEEQK